MTDCAAITAVSATTRTTGGSRQAPRGRRCLQPAACTANCVKITKMNKFRLDRQFGAIALFPSKALRQTDGDDGASRQLLGLVLLVGDADALFNAVPSIVRPPVAVRSPIFLAPAR